MKKLAKQESFHDILLRTQIREAIKELNEIDKTRRWRVSLKSFKLISTSLPKGLTISTPLPSLEMLYLLVASKLKQIRKEIKHNLEYRPFGDKHKKIINESIDKVFDEDSKWLGR